MRYYTLQQLKDQCNKRKFAIYFHSMDDYHREVALNYCLEYIENKYDEIETDYNLILLNKELDNTQKIQLMELDEELTQLRYCYLCRFILDNLDIPKKELQKM